MFEHWFWLVLATVCTVWYSTITVYVSYKGVSDIKHMLDNLKRDHAEKQSKQ